MMLAVDIGNMNINLAVISKNGRLEKRFLSPTYGFNLKTVLKNTQDKIEKIFVVSVVPKVLEKVKRDLKRNFRSAGIFVVGEDVKVPLKCAYNKSEIGQDRLVTAFAAKLLYKLPILIIDFGTAVTFDVVSKGDIYLGGLILPGIKMSLESLSERTALLPKTYLKNVRSFIGRDTISSIRSGMIYGYAALCDGLIRLFRKEISEDINIVATGGDAPLISRYTPLMKRVNQDLSLKGLYFLSLGPPVKKIFFKKKLDKRN